MHAQDILNAVDERARETIIEMLSDGMTLSAVADDLGVNKGLISRVLSGKRSPTVIRALGLPVITTEQVPVCPDCGHVHRVVQRCGDSNRQRIRKCAELTARNDHGAPAKLDAFAHLNGFDDWSDFTNHILDLIDEGTLVMVSFSLPSQQASYARQGGQHAGWASNSSMRRAGHGIIVIDSDKRQRVID